MILGLAPNITIKEKRYLLGRKKIIHNQPTKRNDLFTYSTYGSYKIIDILQVHTGKLCLSITPGKIDKQGNRNLTMDLKAIKDDNIKIIVCLLEWPEMCYLNISDYPKKAQEEGFLFYHLPIPDRGVPQQREVNVLVPLLVKHLSAGRNVLVHCRGGLGRAGTICACCMGHFGYEWKTAIKTVRQKRPGAIQTNKQEKCIMQYCQQLSI